MRSALLPILAVLSVTACAAPAEDDVSSTEDAVTTDAALGEVEEPGEDAPSGGSRTPPRPSSGAPTPRAATASPAATHTRRRTAASRPRSPSTPTCPGSPRRDLHPGQALRRVGPLLERVEGRRPGERRARHGDQAPRRGRAPAPLAGEDPGARTHDFVLSNHHTFFVTNLADYVRFMETVAEKGNPLSFFISWNPFDMHLREAWLARKFTTQPIPTRSPRATTA